MNTRKLLNPQAKQLNHTYIEINKEEILHDYKIACISRQLSHAGRKEVHSGRAKFGIFGDGSYRLQPIHVADFANFMVEQAYVNANTVINGIGSETFTYRGLVERLSDILQVKRPILSVPPQVGYWAGGLIGKLMGDVTITREEIDGLMADLLYVDAPPVGKTKLTDRGCSINRVFTYNHHNNQ